MSIHVDIHLRRSDFDLIFSQEFSPGITVLFGPSGSGKTSVLRAISGLESDVDGNIVVNGDLWLGKHHFEPPEKRRTGMVFQQPSLFSHLSVQQNIDFAAKRARGEGIDVQIAIEVLDIQPLMQRYPDSLSGGEQQRVAIARALASQPAILLLDEPLSSLDVARKQEVLPYLRHLRQCLEIPIVYVTHDPDELARLADQVVLMEKGKIVQAGKVNAILTDLSASLSKLDGATSVFEGKVISFESRHQLMEIDTPAGVLLLPGTEAFVNRTVRLQVAAKDVSIAVSKANDSSIMNLLPAQVLAWREDGAGQIMLKLQVGQTHMVSRISQMSFERLSLDVGDKVFAQIKAVALEQSN